MKTYIRITTSMHNAEVVTFSEKNRESNFNAAKNTVVELQKKGVKSQLLLIPESATDIFYILSKGTAIAKQIASFENVPASKARTRAMRKWSKYCLNDETR